MPLRISSDGKELQGPSPGEAAPRTVIRLALFLIWLLALVLYAYTAMTVPDRSSFLAPDENNTYNVARSLRENGTIYLDSPLNERFDLEIFRGRLYVEVEENRYTSFNSLGLSLIVAAGMYLGAPFLAVPFLASLGVLGIYLITKELAGYREGLAAGLLWGLLPTNLFFSNLMMDIVPAFSLLLLSMGTMLAALKSRSRVLALCSGVSLGLSFFIRQAVAIYVIIILIFIASNWRTFRVNLMLYICAPAATIALLTMIMNKAVYGSLFTASQLEGVGKSASRALLPGFNPSAVFSSLSTYIAQYVPFLLLLGVIGFLVALKHLKGGPKRGFHAAMASMALVTILWFGSRVGTWSFAQLSISGSMARYYTPVYFVLVIYSSVALAWMVKRGRTSLAALLLTALICSYCALAFGTMEYSDVPYLRRRFSAYSAKKGALLEESDQPTVVFTKRMDKDLYNDVEVGLCFTEEDLARNPNISIFPIIDPEKDVLPAIERLADEGWRVLVASDAPELVEVLRARGFDLKPIKTYPRLQELTQGEGE